MIINIRSKIGFEIEKKMEEGRSIVVKLINISSIDNEKVDNKIL